MPRYIHLLILLTLLQIASCTKTPTSPIWNGKADTSWYTADTSATEFTITTAEQLAGLAKLVNNGNDFKGKTINLGANIMLNDTVNWQNWATKPPKNKWKPIGKYIEKNDYIFNNHHISSALIDAFIPKSIRRALRLEPSNFKFIGTFDGNDFLVSGIYINSEETFQGLFGIVDFHGELRNIGIVASYIKGRFKVGGLVGKIEGSVDNCHSAALVTGVNNVGGLVGLAEGSKISNSYSTGAVIGNGAVGGLVGRLFNVRTVITNSYSIAKVTGTGVVGGLVGSSLGGTITDSYSMGIVTGNDDCIGGIIGYAGGKAEYDSYRNTKMINTYSTSIVKGIKCVGGLTGGLYEIGEIINSYYDMQISGQSDTSKGEGKASEQMKQKETFEGWDFENVWGMDSTINNGYPYLR